MVAEQCYPRVCISIPVYNGGAFLAEALESALGQDYPNLRVVAVDNASTDGTRQLLAAVQDERFQPYHYEKHVPVADNWQRAIRCASGDFVLLLSADNVLRPDAVTKLVSALSSSPAYGFAYGRTKVLREEPISRPFGEPLRPPRLGSVTDLERTLLQDGYTIAIDSILFRRSLPELYLNPATRNACDLDLLLRLGQAGVTGIGIAEEVLVRREHGRALSNSRAQMWATTLETLQRHALRSSRPHLYRFRIWRTLLWAMVDTLQSEEPEAATRYFERFSKDVGASRRIFLRSLLAFPVLGRVPSALREVRRHLGALRVRG